MTKPKAPTAPSTTTKPSGPSSAGAGTTSETFTNPLKSGGSATEKQTEPKKP